MDLPKFPMPRREDPDAEKLWFDTLDTAIADQVRIVGALFDALMERFECDTEVSLALTEALLDNVIMETNLKTMARRAEIAERDLANRVQQANPHPEMEGEWTAN